MRLLAVVAVPEPVETLVPSGTMLHVRVAGAPFPDREPDAVESHGSGSFGLIIKPLAGVARRRAQNSDSNAT
jgi:hypothetical protein